MSGAAHVALSLVGNCGATFFGQHVLLEGAQDYAIDEDVDLPRVRSSAAMRHILACGVPSRAPSGAVRTRISSP